MREGEKGSVRFPFDDKYDNMMPSFTTVTVPACRCLICRDRVATIERTGARNFLELVALEH